jgi:hypothetical protein
VPILMHESAHWLARAPRGDDPAIEMRFHDDWWHAIFHTTNGYEVVIGPIGISLGAFPDEEGAKRRAESNARERALNELAEARRAIRRSSLVLGALTHA